ncbi:hypothetical protein [Thermobifida cellulosilytica]|uniref:Uncharacterized protein n=1 Tax=Thermobifida cellulosilytica TB100 TaxID=665004 RepID=A0A147KLI4_THECS|nr:hypothetical protein [Thermobifida cellulosilytica]KUP98113.1 hypothetical protein AC529_02925 [Thermobifida cellulosilytica TB100]
MFAKIRITAKTLILSLGTAGLCVLGGGVAFAAAPAVGLTGIGFSLPGEQPAAEPLPSGRTAERAPITGTSDSPAVSGDLAVLPKGPDTVQELVDELDRQTMRDGGDLGLLLDGTAGVAPDVVPQRGVADPTEQLGLSTEGLLGKGLLGNGLPL